MTIRHLHSDIKDVNGNLYFEVVETEQLIVFFIGTPKYKDSGLWSIEDFQLLKESSKNQKLLELSPYDIKDITLSDQEAIVLDFFNKYPDFEEYPEYKDGWLKMDDELNIIINGKKLPLSSWEDRDDLSLNFGLYNIFVPILSQCIKENS